MAPRPKRRAKAVPPDVARDVRPAAPEHAAGAWPLVDLLPDQCRFACTPDSAGRGGHRFCGERVERLGSPYCAGHAARCFDRRAAVMRMAKRAGVRA